MKCFKDKIAIVTGGAAGIGRGLCEVLIEEGAIVILTDIDKEGAEKTAREITDAGGKAVAKKLDVTKDADIQILVDDVVAQYGRLDYMINNAGLALIGETRDVTLEQVRRLTDVNIHGPLNGSIIAYKQMVRQGFGHIVNVGSITGLNAFPVQTYYSATKHAVQGFSNGLRSEGADLGVKVSVICPMNIKSEMVEGSITIAGEKDTNWFRNLRVNWMDTNKAARKMLKGVARNKGIIIVPSKARMIWIFFRISPAMFGNMGRFMVKGLLRSEGKSH